MGYHPQTHPPPSHDECSSFFITLLTIILFFAFAFIFAITIFAVILNSGQDMQISVSSATISKLSFNSSSPLDQLLTFDLLTNLTFRNPNKNVGIHYDWLQVKGDYNGVRFSWAGLPVFYLEGEGVREVAVEFPGLFMFGRRGGNVTGVVQLDLWVLGGIRYSYGWMPEDTRLLRAVCPLRLSLEKGGGYFTDCKVLDLDSVKRRNRYVRSTSEAEMRPPLNVVHSVFDIKRKVWWG